MLSSLRNFHHLRVAASAGLKGAIPKVLLGAALLGGGGSVLFAGSAQAACNESISFSTWAGGTPLECGDKKFTYSSSTPIPLGATGTVNATNPVDEDYFFNFDFDPISPISRFTVNYIAEVTKPDYFFTGVDLDSDVNAFSPPSEDLKASWRTGSFAGPVVAELISSNGSPSAVLVPGHPKILYVTNEYCSNPGSPDCAGGAIDSFVNSYRQGTKVPGPLPLLGAGMAFGFSRKLRSRIKARVQA